MPLILSRNVFQQLYGAYMSCQRAKEHDRIIKAKGDIEVDKKKIHKFSLYWLGKYKNPETQDYELEEGFAGECFSLGFKMDCGKTFESAYGSVAFHDADELKKTISNIQDIHILGNAVFSQWRYFTHWAYSAIDREWFIIAFSRLAELTK